MFNTIILIFGTGALTLAGHIGILTTKEYMHNKKVKCKKQIDYGELMNETQQENLEMLMSIKDPYKRARKLRCLFMKKLEELEK